MPKLTYVFDTSIFVYYPYCLEDFQNADLIIPIAVLEELDKLKIFPNEVGRNARITIKELEKLDNLHSGCLLPNGSTVRVEVKEDLSKLRDAKYADNRILACALGLKRKNCIVVSRDFNLKLRSKSNGLQAQGYDRDRISTEDLYTGFKKLTLDYTLNKSKEINCEDYSELKELYPNQCVYLEWEERRFAGKKIDGVIKPIKNLHPWGLEMRGIEQAFAVDLLCDPKILLVSLVGLAGCGKTLLSLAAGIEQVLEQKKYKKLIIYKPIQTTPGRELGFLPGTLEEKLMPFQGSIFDSFEILFGTGRSGDKWKQTLEMWQSKDIIQLEALSYIRGRSIPNSLIIIDEAQNLSKEEMKTILTRIGQGSKIIITGDISQIDNPKLDAMDNGLTYTIEKLKNSELTASLTMMKCERSAIAALVAENF